MTLTEYADLECPFCARYSRDVLPTIIDRYVRPGRVKLDLRLLRFISPDSNRAAKAALVAARSDRSWYFVDLFYRNQGRDGTGYATDAFVERLGRAVPGLDGGALIGRAGDPTIERRLTAFEAQATPGRVNSTPSFEIRSGGGSSKRLDVRALEPGAFTGPLDEAVAAAG